MTGTFVASALVCASIALGEPGPTQPSRAATAMARKSRLMTGAPAAPIVAESPASRDVLLYLEVHPAAGTSFNGRTPRSGRGYWGSNPYVPANLQFRRVLREFYSF